MTLMMSSSPSITLFIVTSPIVINLLTRGLLAVETKDSIVLWLAKFKYQKTCSQTVSIAIDFIFNICGLRTILLTFFILLFSLILFLCGIHYHTLIT